MKIHNSPAKILLIEDDELSRELLAIQIAAEGYSVQTADSGEAALQYLAQSLQKPPDAVLADLHMPGISGLDLAHQLRTGTGGSAIVLLAMSASQPKLDLAGAYDGFLKKPFTMEQLGKALIAVPEHSSNAQQTPPDTAPTTLPALDEAIYQRLAGSMPAAQLQQLYNLCLDDAEARIGSMRLAATATDDVTYRQLAHSVKGGSSMVGALELHQLAATAEQNGTTTTNHVDSLDEMLAACGRLRRILIAHESRATS